MKFKIPPIFALWLLVMVTLAIFVCISFSEDMNLGSHTLKKGKFPETLLAQEKEEEPLADTIVVSDSVAAFPEEKIVHGPDSTIRKVLMFGDSMTHYLAMSIGKYGTRNNYSVTSVTWVSSSIQKWSKTDKIKKYLDMVQPDFIMISLGANDINLRNFEAKAPEIRKIISQIDDVPYIWIGPPLWKKDQGLYAMLARTVGEEKLFEIGLDFKMPRARDHIHPTKKGADLWADTLMRWVRTTDKPLLAEVPDTIETAQHHQFIYLQPNQ